MEAQLQEQFDRIERALTQLTRSISSYKPAPEAVKELLSANTALEQGITDLATHQTNHQRIQNLRHASTALDVQLATHMRSLSILRQSIKAIQLRTPSAGTRLVPSADVIAFGNATAPFLAPPSFQPPSALREAAAAVAAVAEPQTQQPGIGKATPSEATSPVKLPGTTEGSPDSATPMGAMSVGGENASLDDAQGNPGLHSLSDADRAFLDPNTGTPFVPWISEIMIHSSQLKAYQGKPQEVLARLQSDRAAFENLTKNAAGGGEDVEQHPLEPGASQPPQRPEQGTIPLHQTENQPDVARAATFQDWDD